MSKKYYPIFMQCPIELFEQQGDTPVDPPVQKEHFANINLDELKQTIGSNHPLPLTESDFSFIPNIVGAAESTIMIDGFIYVISRDKHKMYILDPSSDTFSDTTFDIPPHYGYSLGADGNLYSAEGFYKYDMGTHTQSHVLDENKYNIPSTSTGVYKDCVYLVNYSNLFEYNVLTGEYRDIPSPVSISNSSNIVPSEVEDYITYAHSGRAYICNVKTGEINAYKNGIEGNHVTWTPYGVYVWPYRGNEYCRITVDGTITKFTMPGDTVRTAPLNIDGNIYVAGEYHFSIVNAKTGEMQTTEFPAKDMFSSAVLGNGVVYFFPRSDRKPIVKITPHGTCTSPSDAQLQSPYLNQAR